MTIRTDLAYAQKLDQQDELSHFRDRFFIDDPDLVYLDGNSLGRLPKATIDRTHELVAHQWGSRLIRSWNEGWIHLQEKVGAKIASLLGAQPDEIIIADSTSVNLFKLALSAINLQPNRLNIVTDDLNFPSDLYILQGVCKQANPPRKLIITPSHDGIHGPVDGLEKALDSDTALLSLSHTVFKSGYTYNMREVTRMAHDAGAMILWDLSHSAGSVPINLNRSGAKLAIGCTYKYLNGGPGSPAFIYIHRQLQEKLSNPISGWMGQKDMFNFDLEYEPAHGLRRFLTGTPPIISTCAIEPGVDLLLEAGMDRLREKSIRQTEYLINLWEALLKPLGYTLNSPLDPDFRGSHISIGHEEAWRIDQVLINDLSVLPDFRKPDNIRLGIVPLYTTFTQIHTAINCMRTAVTERLYENYSREELEVT